MMSMYQSTPTPTPPVTLLLAGVRSAFAKSFGVFEDCSTLELLSRTVDFLRTETHIPISQLRNLAAGVSIAQTQHPNVAREALLLLGLPQIPGYTVNTGCLSGLQVVTDAIQQIRTGQQGFFLASAAECWSDVPIVYSREARKFLLKLSKAKSAAAKLNMITNFNAKAWLPKAPLREEPYTDLTLTAHAEQLALETGITRSEQDTYAWLSHSRALEAEKQGLWKERRIPIWPSPHYTDCVQQDHRLQHPVTQEALRTMEPVVDPEFGTLTHGNAAHPCDGAAVCLLADAETARTSGLDVQARLVDHVYCAFSPESSFLLGSAAAIAQLLQRNGLTLSQIDLFEMHEGSAVQILATQQALASPEYCRTQLGLSDALGEIPFNKLNIRGGALTLGHPYGASGLRMIMNIADELRRSGGQWGIVTLCGSGAMSGALLIQNPSFT